MNKLNPVVNDHDVLQLPVQDWWTVFQLVLGNQASAMNSLSEC